MLEDMLLKWAAEGKRRSRNKEMLRLPHIGNSSICTESSPHTPPDPISPPRKSENDQSPGPPNPPKITGLGRGKIILQGLVSEEQAIILRDERLLAASDPNPRQLSISLPPSPSSLRMKLPTPALTVENMALLNREYEVNPFDLIPLKKTASDGSDGDGSMDPGSTPAQTRTPCEPKRELVCSPCSQVTVIPADKRPALDR